MFLLSLELGSYSHVEVVSFAAVAVARGLLVPLLASRNGQIFPLNPPNGRTETIGTDLLRRVLSIIKFNFPPATTTPPGIERGCFFCSEQVAFSQLCSRQKRALSLALASFWPPIQSSWLFSISVYEVRLAFGHNGRNSAAIFLWVAILWWCFFSVMLVQFRRSPLPAM